MDGPLRLLATDSTHVLVTQGLSNAGMLCMRVVIIRCRTYQIMFPPDFFVLLQRTGKSFKVGGGNMSVEMGSQLRMLTCVSCVWRADVFIGRNRFAYPNKPYLTLHVYGGPAYNGKQMGYLQWHVINIGGVYTSARYFGEGPPFTIIVKNTLTKNSIL